MKTVYKLVARRSRDSVLRSWSESDAAVMVIYSPGEWAVPQISGTPLFAFSSEEWALCWGGNSLFTQLWEAQADIAKPYNPHSFGQSFYGRHDAWAYNWLNWQDSTNTESVKGIVLCGKIKLLRKVKS